MTTPKPDFLAAADGMLQIVEMVKGYRATLQTEMPDLPGVVVDQMVADFHRMILTKLK